MRLHLFALAVLFPIAAGAQNPPERWELVETIRIGGIDGPNALTEVHYLLLSPDGGQIFVAQNMEHLIRVFDSASGKLLDTIGRGGNGPGEFQGLGRIGWKQDTLYAVDRRLHRISLFTGTGEHLRTDRISSPPLSATQRPAVPMALSADGTVIGESMINMSSAASGLVTSSPVVLMTGEGEILRTLAEREIHDDFSVAAVGDRIVFFKQPFSNDLLLDIAPAGRSIVVAHTPASSEDPANFQVTRIRLGSSSDTIFNRTYRYTPRSIPDEVADSIYREYAPGDDPSFAAIESMKEVVRLPAFYPPISALSLGAEGTTWLRREDTGTDWVTWLVLDRQGRIEAIARAPAGLTILAVNGDEVWGMVRDDLDVPYVVGYTVRPMSNH